MIIQVEEDCSHLDEINQNQADFVVSEPNISFVLILDSHAYNTGGRQGDGQ